MVTPSSNVAPGFQLQYAETVSHWMFAPQRGTKGSSMASFILLTEVGTLMKRRKFPYAQALHSWSIYTS